MTPWSAPAAELQSPADRADPAVVQEQLQDAATQEARRHTPAEFSRDERREDALAPSRTFVVGAIRVDGAAALTPEAFAFAIEPYLGRELGPEELRSLARDVAAVARRAGYGLATAWIPPQDVVNGILRVRVDEGRIDSVEVEGAAQALVEPRLAPLAGGSPVTTAELERRLRIAGDLPGVTIGQARLLRRGGRNILAVSTAYDRARGQVRLDNWGTDAVGPWRLRASVDLNGLVASGDRLSLGGVVTPIQPDEFQLVSGGYSVPLGRAGTEVQARGYVGVTDAGAGLRHLDLEGISYELALSASHPLRRRRTGSLWATFELAMRDSELSRLDLPVRDDRIATATAGLYGAGPIGGGFARARLSLVQGLDLLGATRRGDPLASRRDGDAVFTKVTFWADYSRRLGGRFSLAVRGEGQVATRPLLSSEEMGLGGQSFLRAYDYREQAGERGAAVAAEIRFDLRNLPRPLRSGQLYVFADAGHVSNMESGTGGGSLAATGAGLRLWALHGVEASVELGVPLRDGAGGRRPDPRLSFTLGTRF